MLLGCLVTFMTRNVHSNFNESKHIAFSMYTFFFTTILLAPVCIFLTDHTAVTFIMSFGIFWIAAGTLVFMFGPKFYLLLYKHDEKAANSRLFGTSASQSSYERAMARGNYDMILSEENNILRLKITELENSLKSNNIPIPTSLNQFDLEIQKLRQKTAIANSPNSPQIFSRKADQVSDFQQGGGFSSGFGGGFAQPNTTNISGDPSPNRNVSNITPNNGNSRIPSIAENPRNNNNNDQNNQNNQNNGDVTIAMTEMTSKDKKLEDSDAMIIVTGDGRAVEGIVDPDVQ